MVCFSNGRQKREAHRKSEKSNYSSIFILHSRRETFSSSTVSFARSSMTSFSLGTTVSSMTGCSSSRPPVKAISPCSFSDSSRCRMRSGSEETSSSSEWTSLESEALFLGGAANSTLSLMIKRETS